MSVCSYKKQIKYVASLILVAFLVQDVAWASPDPGVFQRLHAPTVIAHPISQTDLLKDPFLIRVPFESSMVKEIHHGSNGKLLIHIQDAHANFSGQLNLAKTLETLSRAYNINLILGEGSEGDMTLDRLKTVADQKTWKIAAKRFLQDGVIVGEEYLNLTSDLPLKIIGVEDQKLYDKSLEVYAKLTQNRQEVLTYLHTIRISLDRLKNRLYPKELLSYEQYKKDALDDPSKRLELLEPLAQSQKINWSDYPEAKKLLNLKSQERIFSYESIGNEQENLLSALRSKNKGQEVTKLLEALKKSSSFSQMPLWEELFRLSEDSGATLKEYPHLTNYRTFMKSFTEIDLEQAQDQIELLEDEIYRTKLPEESTRKLKAIERFLELLDRAYKIQMSSKDFEALVLNRKDFPTIPWQAFLNNELSKLNYFQDLIPYKETLSKALKPLFDFYDLVDQRDKAFIQHSKEALTNSNQNTAFLITGGYHTSHLTELLRQEDYSYVVLTPIVQTETDLTQYEKILLAPLRMKHSSTHPTKAPKTSSAIDTQRQMYFAGERGAIGAARLADVYRQGLPCGLPAEAISGAIEQPDAAARMATRTLPDWLPKAPPLRDFRNLNPIRRDMHFPEQGFDYKNNIVRAVLNGQDVYIKAEPIRVEGYVRRDQGGVVTDSLILREARLLARMRQNPELQEYLPDVIGVNIVSEEDALATRHLTYDRDVVFQSGQAYLVLKAVGGQTLDDLILKNSMIEKSKLNYKNILRVFYATEQMIRVFNRNGYYIRDLSSSDIFILPDGRIRLIDYDISVTEGDDSEFGVKDLARFNSDGRDVLLLGNDLTGYQRHDSRLRDRLFVPMLIRERVNELWSRGINVPDHLAEEIFEPVAQLAADLAPSQDRIETFLKQDPNTSLRYYADYLTKRFVVEALATSDKASNEVWLDLLQRAYLDAEDFRNERNGSDRFDLGASLRKALPREARQELASIQYANISDMRTLVLVLIDSGSVDVLANISGLTLDEFIQYRKKIKDYTDAIIRTDRQAHINAASFDPSRVLADFSRADRGTFSKDTPGARMAGSRVGRIKRVLMAGVLVSAVIFGLMPLGQYVYERYIQETVIIAQAPGGNFNNGYSGATFDWKLSPPLTLESGNRVKILFSDEFAGRAVEILADDEALTRDGGEKISMNGSLEVEVPTRWLKRPVSNVRMRYYIGETRVEDIIGPFIPQTANKRSRPSIDPRKPIPPLDIRGLQILGIRRPTTNTPGGARMAEDGSDVAVMGAATVTILTDFFRWMYHPKEHEVPYLVIDGPSGGGKSTLANALKRALRRLGYRVAYINLDIFMIDPAERARIKSVILEGRMQIEDFDETSFWYEDKIRGVFELINGFRGSNEPMLRLRIPNAWNAAVKRPYRAPIRRNIDRKTVVIIEGKYACTPGLIPLYGDNSFKLRVLRTDESLRHNFATRESKKLADEEVLRRQMRWHDEVLLPAFKKYDQQPVPGLHTLTGYEPHEDTGARMAFERITGLQPNIKVLVLDWGGTILQDSGIRDDVKPFLEEMKRRQIPIWILSGEHASVIESELQQAGLDSLVTSVLSTQDKTQGFKTILERMNAGSASLVQAGQMAMIGNSGIDDVRNAKDVGLVSVGMLWSIREHTKSTMPYADALTTGFGPELIDYLTSGAGARMAEGRNGMMPRRDFLSRSALGIAAIGVGKLFKNAGQTEDRAGRAVASTRLLRDADGLVFLGEKEPGIAYYPDRAEGDTRAMDYRQLLDATDGGTAQAQKIYDAGFRVIKIYLTPADDLEAIGRITEAIHASKTHPLKTLLVYSPHVMRILNLSPSDRTRKIGDLVGMLAKQPWMQIQLGNEDNYYRVGQKLGAEDGIDLTREAFFDLYDEIAGQLKDSLKKLGNAKRPILLGHGFDPFAPNADVDLERIARMKHIDAVAANLYLSHPTLYSAAMRHLSTMLPNLPIIVGEFGASRHKSDADGQTAFNTSIWSEIRNGIREGNCAGGVLFAWSDKSVGQEAPGSSEALKLYDRVFGIRETAGSDYYQLQAATPVLRPEKEDLTEVNFWKAAHLWMSDSEDAKQFFIRYVREKSDSALTQAGLFREVIRRTSSESREPFDSEVNAFGDLHLTAAAHYYLAAQALFKKDWKSLRTHAVELAGRYSSAKVNYGEGAFWSPAATLFGTVEFFAKVATASDRAELNGILKLLRSIPERERGPESNPRHSWFATQIYGIEAGQNWRTWFRKFDAPFKVHADDTLIKIRIRPKPGTAPFKALVRIVNSRGMVLERLIHIKGAEPYVVLIPLAEARRELGDNFDIQQLEVAEGVIHGDTALNPDNSEHLNLPPPQFELYGPSGARMAVSERASSWIGEFKKYNHSNRGVYTEITIRAVLETDEDAFFRYLTEHYGALNLTGIYVDPWVTAEDIRELVRSGMSRYVQSEVQADGTLAFKWPHLFIDEMAYLESKQRYVRKADWTLQDDAYGSSPMGYTQRRVTMDVIDRDDLLGKEPFPDLWRNLRLDWALRGMLKIMLHHGFEAYVDIHGCRWGSADGGGNLVACIAFNHISGTQRRELKKSESVFAEYLFEVLCREWGARNHGELLDIQPQNRKFYGSDKQIGAVGLNTEAFLKRFADQPPANRSGARMAKKGLRQDIGDFRRELLEVRDIDDPTVITDVVAWIDSISQIVPDQELARRFYDLAEELNDRLILKNYMIHSPTGSEGWHIALFKILKIEIRSTNEGDFKVLFEDQVYPKIKEDERFLLAGGASNLREYVAVHPDNSRHLFQKVALPIINGGPTGYTPAASYRNQEHGSEIALALDALCKKMMVLAYSGRPEDMVLSERISTIIDHEVEHLRLSRKLTHRRYNDQYSLLLDEHLAELASLRNPVSNPYITLSNLVSRALITDRRLAWFLLARLLDPSKEHVKNSRATLSQLKRVRSLSLVEEAIDSDMSSNEKFDIVKQWNALLDTAKVADIRAMADKIYPQVESEWKANYGLSGARMAGRLGEDDGDLPQRIESNNLDDWQELLDEARRLGTGSLPAIPIGSVSAGAWDMVLDDLLSQDAGRINGALKQISGEALAYLREGFDPEHRAAPKASAESYAGVRRMYEELGGITTQKPADIQAEELPFKKIALACLILATRRLPWKITSRQFSLMAIKIMSIAGIEEMDHPGVLTDGEFDVNLPMARAPDMNGYMASVLMAISMADSLLAEMISKRDAVSNPGLTMIRHIIAQIYALAFVERVWGLEKVAEYFNQEIGFDVVEERYGDPKLDASIDARIWIRKLVRQFAAQKAPIRWSDILAAFYQTITEFEKAGKLKPSVFLIDDFIKELIKKPVFNPTGGARMATDKGYARAWVNAGGMQIPAAVAVMRGRKPIGVVVLKDKPRIKGKQMHLIYASKPSSNIPVVLDRSGKIISVGPALGLGSGSGIESDADDWLLDQQGEQWASTPGLPSSLAEEALLLTAGQKNPSQDPVSDFMEQPEAGSVLDMVRHHKRFGPLVRGDADAMFRIQKAIERLYEVAKLEPGDIKQLRKDSGYFDLTRGDRRNLKQPMPMDAAEAALTALVSISDYRTSDSVDRLVSDLDRAERFIRILKDEENLAGESDGMVFSFPVQWHRLQWWNVVDQMTEAGSDDRNLVVHFDTPKMIDIGRYDPQTLRIDQPDSKRRPDQEFDPTVDLSSWNLRKMTPLKAKRLTRRDLIGQALVVIKSGKNGGRPKLQLVVREHASSDEKAANRWLNPDDNPRQVDFRLVLDMKKTAADKAVIQRVKLHAVGIEKPMRQEIYEIDLSTLPSLNGEAGLEWMRRFVHHLFVQEFNGMGWETRDMAASFGVKIRKIKNGGQALKEKGIKESRRRSPVVRKLRGARMAVEAPLHVIPQVTVAPALLLPQMDTVPFEKAMTVSMAGFGGKANEVMAVPVGGLVGSPLVRRNNREVVAPVLVSETVEALGDKIDVKAINRAVQNFAQFVEANKDRLVGKTFALVVGEGLYEETRSSLASLTRVLKGLGVHLVVVGRNAYDNKTANLPPDALLMNLVDVAGVGGSIPNAPVLAVSPDGRGTHSFNTVLSAMALIGLAACDKPAEFVYHFGSLMSALGHPMSFSANDIAKIEALKKFELRNTPIIVQMAILRSLSLARAISAAQLAVIAVRTAA